MKIQTTNKFELTFKTKSQNGLILYTGNGNLNSYLLIAFISGKLVYSFSLPKQKQVFTLSSPTRLNDNKWHSIVIERNKRKATLTIDGSVKLNATFDEINYVGFGNLATDGYLRIGGYRKLPFGMAQSLHQGFQGCMFEFKIDDRLIDLIKHNLNTNYYPSLCSAMNGTNEQKIKKVREKNSTKKQVTLRPGFFWSI